MTGQNVVEEGWPLLHLLWLEDRGDGRRLGMQACDVGWNSLARVE